MAGANVRLANNVAKQRAIYPIERITFGSRDLQKRYEEILGPLTLFAPKFDEEASEKVDLEVERPVTPIDESIKAPPTTFSQLARLIRRRIAADNDCPSLSVEEQQMLAGVIMGEVNSIWPDIRRQVDDPFLTCEENKELQRRITVHVVTVCEQLFQHYVEKAKMLTDRGVFSGVANMSRLKAQVSLDANKFLNILAIRRHIVADIRGDYPESEDSYPILTSPRPTSRQSKEEKVPFTYQKLIETSRPKRRKHHRPTVEQQIRDMTSQMPTLYTSKVLDYLPDLQTMQRGMTMPAMTEEETETLVETDKQFGMWDSRADRTESLDVTKKLVDADEPGAWRLPRSNSLPEFHPYESIFEEIGIEEQPLDTDRPRSAERHRPKVSLDEPKEDKVQAKPSAGSSVRPATTKARPDSRYCIKQDLKKLSQYRSAKEERKKEQLPEEEDLPPLLQAVDHNERREIRRAMMRRKMQEAELEAAKKEEEEIIEIREPTHPQPATVTTKLPNQSTVRTSDVRVSERVSQTAVTLKLYRTVFNELTDEVDGNTVKKLDANLFRGQEIKEVYQEILKTLPTDHMTYDMDEFVETAAGQYSLHKAPLLASTTLNRSKNERVLNPALIQKDDAPWGKERDKWCESPIFNATFARHNPARVTPFNNTSLLHGTTSLLGDSLGLGLGGGGGGADGAGGAGGGMSGMPSMSGMPRAGFGMGMMMDDRNARAYTSWLQWWKNTVSCEDYVKYVSTQETDFLGAVFHFYESDNESDTSKTVEKVSSAKLERRRERELKLEELRVQKKEFVPGQWNVATVMSGGLGKDPEVEDNNDDAESMSPDTMPRFRRRTHSCAMSRSASRNTITPRGGSPPLLSRQSDLQSRGTYRATSRTSLTLRSDTESPVKEKITTQTRLENIWSSLQMPDNLRLDMAIKYSSDGHMHLLEEAIKAWEKAMNLILKRESILTSLEDFERFASDPDRFFQKGFRGSSVARLEEAKQRSDIYVALNAVDTKVRKRVRLVEKKFEDVMTFQGRPYLEKMKLDCTEMLYWLQQERRQMALERSTLAQEVKIPLTDLPPIHSVAPSVTPATS